MIGFNATEVLSFYHFVNVAGKCLFPLIWRSFFLGGGDFDPLKLWRHHSTPKIYSFRGDTRFEVLCFKIGSEVSSVGLSKKALCKKYKKVIGRTPKSYTSPIWGAAPNNLTVIIFCVWVSFPDVINCARFYLCRPNSFLGGRTPKFAFFHWLEKWPLQQLELFRALLWIS